MLHIVLIIIYTTVSLQIINARRTESIDAPEIYKLLSPVTKSQFGPVNIVHLIEKANLSVTLCNEENEVCDIFL